MFIPTCPFCDSDSCHYQVQLYMLSKINMCVVLTYHIYFSNSFHIKYLQNGQDVINVKPPKRHNNQFLV